MNPKPTRALSWLNCAAWLLTIAAVVGQMGDGDRYGTWDGALGLLALLGVAACVAWLRSWRHGRAMVLGTAALYLGFYALRMFVLEIQPLLAIMSLPEAVADAFYVVWSFPVGRLSHGEVIDAMSGLFRDCFMPLIQAGVLLAWPRLR